MSKAKQTNLLDDNEGTVRITDVEVRDIMRVKYARVSVEGSTLVVGGKNGQGKSSFLDSIAMAIGGKKLCPSEPIRKGRAGGTITVKTDGNHHLLPGKCTITRTFEKRPDGSTRSNLEIMAEDGYPAPTPQGILDAIVSKSAFDPLVFLKLKPKEQVNSLASLLGVDLQAFDFKRKHVFDKRTEVNRTVSQRESEIAAIKVPDDAPDEVVPLSSIMAEHAEATAHNSKITQAKRAAEQAAAKIPEAEREAVRIKRQIEELQARLKEAEDYVGKCKANAEAAAKAAADMPPPIDVSVIQSRMEGAERANEAARAKQQKKQKIEKLQEAREAAAKLTEEIKAIDAEKAEAIAAAEFPVPGMSFGDGGLVLDGVPFEQASTAQQLRVAVAMGLKSNAALRMLIMREGSMLDDDNLKVVADEAEKLGGQLFIERVSEGSECSVVIRDGQIVDDGGETGSETSSVAGSDEAAESVAG